MRIIHVKDNFHPNYGYQINEILNVQKDMDDEIIVVSTRDMSYFQEEFDESLDREFEKKTGIKIIRLDYLFKIASRIWYKDLFKTIDKLNPDVVFMHVLCDFKDLILYRKKRKYKIYRDCHMSWVASTRKGSKLFYKFYELFFSKIINNTDKYEKVFALGVEEYQYLKAIGIDDSKIDYLYHGYNDDEMYYSEKERAEVRANYKINDDEIVISYIGKFNYSKRPDLIFDIVNQVDKEILEKNKITLLFIGSKDKEFMEFFNKKLKDTIPSIRVIEDSAKQFKDLRKYFSASDICIFPKETTLSSIHAQVCGCSVVMEMHDSNVERVLLKENLYKVDDINESGFILSRIIKNKEYIKNMELLREIENREYKKQIKKLNLGMVKK